MKPTQLKELLRSIKGSLPTYLSILSLVFFAVMLFIGIGGTDVVMSGTANSVSTEYLAYDYKVTMPYGIDKEDIDNLTDYAAAEGYYEEYAFFDHNDEKYQIRLVNIGKNVNIPFEIEGALPKNGSEIALAKSFAKKHDLHIGQKITLDIDNGNGETKQVTVCGFMESTAYIGTPDFTLRFSERNYSAIDITGYAADDFFDAESYAGYYIRMDSSRDKNFFEEEYADIIRENFTQVKSQAGVINDDRYDGIKAQMDAFGIEAPEKLEPVIASRLDDAGYSVTDIIHSILSKVKWTMALIFIIVGLFVCFFSVSRLVRDHAVRIGNKLALGFVKKEITLWYLGYTFSAVVPGVILAIPFAVWIIESIIKASVAPLIAVTDIGFGINPADLALIIVVEFGFLGLATILACKKVVKKEILQLLSNSSDAKGKKRFYHQFSFWEKTPVFTKTIVNNSLNEPRRILATIISIASCAMLIISSFTLLFNSVKTQKVQYSKIQQYDRIAFFDSFWKSTEDEKKIISEEFEKCTDVNLTHCMIFKTDDGDTAEADSASAMLFAADNESLLDFMHFYSLDSGTETNPGSGVMIPSAMARACNIKTGDKVAIIDSSAKRTEWTVDCIYEDYSLIQNVFINKSIYDEKTNELHRDNAILFNADEKSTVSTENKLADVSNFITLLDYKTYGNVAFQIIIRLMKVVVLIYLFASIVVAVFVCNNLLQMYINEKKRDIIILIINGYSEASAKKYIITDTLINAPIGIIISIFLGHFMGILSIRTFITDFTTFITEFNIFASIIGAVAVTLIMIVLSARALKQINHYNLADVT